MEDERLESNQSTELSGEKKARRISWLMVAVVIVLIMQVVIFVTVSQLKQTTSEMKSNMSYMQNQIQDIGNNAAQQISSAMEAENSIINDFTCTVGSYNKEDKTVEVRYTVIPKEWKQGAQLKIACKAFEVQLQQNPANSAEFTASVWLPLSADISDAKIIYTVDGLQKTETPAYYGSIEEAIPRLTASYSGRSSSSPDGKTVRYVLQGSVECGMENTAAYSVDNFSSCYIIGQVGDKKVYKKKVELERGGTVTVDIDETFEVKSGEIFSFYATAKGQNGLNYKILLDNQKFDSSGQPSNGNNDFQQMVVMDDNGTVLLTR